MPFFKQTTQENADVPGAQPPDLTLTENTPLEFRVLLSACRLFLGTEEPAALEALLRQKGVGVIAITTNKHE